MDSKEIKDTRSQWLFDPGALWKTPSIVFSSISRERELLDRARGVEFIFRVGVQLQISLTAMLTAATYFHRFYMRYSFGDFHRVETAGSCIFLSTKIEECGRKVRDVANICMSKAQGIPPVPHEEETPELIRWQTKILANEETLLEALCFDFFVQHPHALLSDLFERLHKDCDPKDLNEKHFTLQDYAWSIANDSLRTPLCVLHSSSTIAAACFAIAHAIVEEPKHTTLQERLSECSGLISSEGNEEASFHGNISIIDAVKFFNVQPSELADAIVVLLDFYHFQADYIKTTVDGQVFGSNIAGGLSKPIFT
ncbi:cyclin-like protein [Sistotremastrum suecicum HHB10207 ss-3]|uniref:Cyclin-like protein n=1 Tax=Sistotremastrum suecicum HHB10207 ss-3 TaxID=1314776 RepID=A0A165Y9H8_9AGAM|nr:cyclin-like protein [Sistotremastrum suecicum HHB10207 ss-3]